MTVMMRFVTVCTICYLLLSVSHKSLLRPEFSMGWVDPWVWLGRVGLRFFSFWWVGSTIAKVLKIAKDYVDAFKARLDKIFSPSS